MARGNYYNTNENVKTKLLEKRAGDYTRMVKAIEAMGVEKHFSRYEFDLMREGHEREYAAFSTLRENDVIVEVSSKWVAGGFRRSSSQKGYSRRDVRFYDDGAGHVISTKQYDNLCEVYGQKYVKDVLGFKFLEYRTYAPSHCETTYGFDGTNLTKIYALEKTFRTICEEVL